MATNRFTRPHRRDFALFSILALRGSLNILSQLGILALFGVVKKNAILQIDHSNQLRAHGLDRDTAIMAASRDRLRPILMTTIAFVAGMIPLAVSRGVGAETNRAMSSVIIGGQMLSLVLTLIAIPVIYSVFDDLAALRLWSRMRRMASGLAAWAVQVPLARRAAEPSPETMVELPADGREEGLDDHAASGPARLPHGQAAVDDDRLPGDVTRTR